MFKHFRSTVFRTFLGAFLLYSVVQSAMPISAQQQPQRERRVATAVANAIPTPSPSPTASPSPFATPGQGPVAFPPTPSPTPTPDVALARAAATTRTLSELQVRISQVLQKPELAPTMVGIKVTSLETGKVLFEVNADKLLRPASNMKLYTVAAALDRLSPDYRFVTSVYAQVKPDADGVVHGNLTIYGRGDPSIAARFNNGDYLKGIDDLAARIAATGLKRVEGDLVGDETYFSGPQYGSGWEWEDLQWWYGAEVSSLTSNDNSLDLSVKPGAEVGAPAVITTGPPDPLLKIANRVTTAAKGTRRNLTVHRGLASDEVEISGSMALDDTGYSGSIAISHPALLFSYLLRASLAQRGVTIIGKTRTVPPAVTAVPGFSVDPVRAYEIWHPGNTGGSPPVEIVQFRSPPLSLIAAQTLKPSQNLYTELILRTLGEVHGLAATATTTKVTSNSEAAGLEVVKIFLQEAGIGPPTLVLTDGSGLSWHDMVTADATVQLLTYMHHHRYASVFRDALPIAGVDGTLKNRFKGTLAENNLRAKTGTLSSASSLSGYVRDAAGEELVFSIMVNNYPENADVRAGCIEPIAILLASFAGKSEK